MSLLERPTESPEEHRLKVARKKLREEDVSGLDGVISSLEKTHDSGTFEDLKSVFKSRNQFFPDPNRINYEMPEDSVYSLAKANRTYLKRSRSFMFNSIYKQIEFRYVMTTKKAPDEIDLENIYLSGLDERLLFAQEKFDEVSQWPKPSEEFFQQLKSVKWDKDTFKLAKKLLRFKNRLEYDILHQISYQRLALIEEEFIELMAMCSAVKDNRNIISKDDLIKGYKTYLKLLNTDVTHYKSRKALRKYKSNGFLVCDSCGFYYGLQDDESPDDFLDECECGGKLVYSDSKTIS